MTLFVTQARHHPDDPAIVWRDTEVSYLELHERVCGAQFRLDRLHLPPGVPVAVRAVKSPDTIALILALLGDARPFLLPPAGLPDETFAALVEASGAQAVLEPEPITPVGGDLRVVDRPDSTSFMLTTSGSTGIPKIVPLTAAGVGRFTAWASARFNIGPQRTVLNYAPLNFDLCLLDIWTTLAVGGRVVLVEPEHATRAGYLHDLIDRHRVHVVQAVPMLFHLLFDQHRPLPGVTHVIATGDALTARGLAGLPELFPNARLHNLYGCTETNDSFLHEIDPATDRAPLPIGRPICGVDALLVDSAGQVLNGPGLGELHVSTPFQTTGYADATLNPAAFGPHPEGTTDRVYFRSGDLLRRTADGSLTLEGRADFHVKVRGVRVNTQAVERALLELDEVAGAVVFALPDQIAGNALHAVIHRRDPHTLHSLAVRAHCARRLSRAAVPTAIELTDEPLPTTSTGKPDRARIKQTYLEGQR
ncbi:MAG TPA: AMP-binding protein [Pseudonocardiaceae bacterium]|nr:AMP-binding protein [Pseudonocardiaceae bacterium]